MQCRDLMTHRIAVCSLTDSVSECAGALKAQPFPLLVVLDEGRQAVGVVGRVDAFAALLRGCDLTAEDIMEPLEPFCHPEDDVAVAARAIGRAGKGYALVVQNDLLRGWIGIGDVLEAMKNNRPTRTSATESVRPDSVEAQKQAG